MLRTQPCYRSPAPPPPIAPAPPALVLIADGVEWSARAYESVLGSGGFAVLRAASARQALAQARAAAPDVVLLNADPPTSRAPSCAAPSATRAPSGHPRLSSLTCASALAREGRLAALRAGAWDVLTLPLDAVELLVRATTALRRAQREDGAPACFFQPRMTTA